MKKKVVFIGALENGYIVLNTLLDNANVDVISAFTYEDEIQLKKPFGKNSFESIYPDILKINNINKYTSKIVCLKPDFIFVAGWSQILNKQILSAAKEGCIGFHPSKLPRDRGRSVLAWQIAEGYTETALSMFYLTENVDAGDIIAQEYIKIDEDDYISDVYKKINYATYNLMCTYLPLILKGKAPRIRQNERYATYRRLRGEQDGKIDWNKPSKDIHNLVRAIAPPYPCAYTYINGQKVRISKGRIISDIPEKYWVNEKPGNIIAYWKNKTWFRTRDGIYEVTFLDKGL